MLREDFYRRINKEKKNFFSKLVFRFYNIYFQYVTYLTIQFLLFLCF